MMEKNITLETIGAIDRAIERSHGACKVSDPKERARLAWWIWENFVDKDFVAQSKSLNEKVPTTRA